jgi:hypothetical protein
MKKTLIILFLALSIVGRGQTFSTLLHDKQKVFNVLDYGAVSDDAVSDVTAINNALDDGDGLILSGQCVLGVGDAITLTYNKTFDYWIEISRSNN